MNVVNTYFFVPSHAFEDNRSSLDINYYVYLCTINLTRIVTCKEKLKEIFLVKQNIGTKIRKSI